MKYKITLTKTSNGAQDYLQIISEDQFSTNIVLIGEFELKDYRAGIPAEVISNLSQRDRESIVARIEKDPKKTIREKVLEMCEAGYIIDAIKYIRRRKNLPLKEAKEFVDRVRDV